MVNNSSSLAVTLLVLGFVVVAVKGHGYILDPPSRSSLWRLGFPGAPVNYNDNSLFCGGFGKQYNSVNKGRCGECGDEWSLPRPRSQEEGGPYYKGIIGQRYKAGSLVRMTVMLTAGHMGYFEFKLCPKNSSSALVTQECFDRYPLTLIGNTTRLPVGGSGWYDAMVWLPAGVTCNNCVIQWTYTTGNSWGTCPDGSGQLGCGNQETFRNCADVSIRSK